MTVIDRKVVPLADSLIKKYGKTMTFVRDSAAAYNATTGEAAVTTQQVKLKGVFSGPSKVDLQNGLAQLGDAYVTIAAAALSTMPKPTDELLIDGHTWRVIDVLVTYSGEEMCVYKVHIRR